LTTIVARDLGKRFGRTIGLAGVDLEIGPGSSLAVLGPNGAGKSTLLRLMAGLARATSGSLTIGGQPAHKREARAQVGFLGHATALYPALTARENLIFAGRLHGVSEPGARADALLAEEGLTRVAERPAGAFSRGMAQRLAIARGLVHDPAVVLLDEPFTGLDGRAAQRLSARLTGLRERGCTLVLVTHDVVQAAQLCASAVVLAHGRIAERADGELDAASLERAYANASDSAASAR
jgi:heme exporter protein A